MMKSFHNKDYSKQHDESIDRDNGKDQDDNEGNYDSARSHNEGVPSGVNSLNASKLDEDQTDDIYSYQVKTRRFAVLIIILGLLIMLLGYSALSYDLVEMRKARDTGKYEFTIKSDKRDPNKESNQEEDQGLRFELNKYTFFLLAGVSILMDTMTFVEGILVLFISIKAVVSIQKLISNGHNIFKPDQGKTRNIFDVIILMVIIQLTSSIVQSGVLFYVLHKATNQFERQYGSNDSIQVQEEERSIQNFQNIMVTRSAITIIFFSLGCFLNLIVLRQFRNYQKRYEDMILERLDETYRLGQSQKPTAIVVHE
ncbi:UNKNOWN [Stylonychia lemnae]|uniref:Uncharacterized protein n=1 Tax=Stylonychia lemnae TaxID=5949 RepID=A0A078AP40_STYLE|nr:UNKNOWN [Stylonychia lemnae]|eukprot:CDW83889.1 UNKNOWN [Stylonychia lemnae]